MTFSLKKKKKKKWYQRLSPGPHMFGKPPPLSHISPDPSPILKYVAYARYHTRRERHSIKDVAFKEYSFWQGKCQIIRKSAEVYWLLSVQQTNKEHQCYSLLPGLNCLPSLADCIAWPHCALISLRVNRIMNSRLRV